MSQAELEYPGWLGNLLTDPVKGLDNYHEQFKKLTSPNGAIKVFCQVAYNDKPCIHHHPAFTLTIPRTK